MFWLNELAEVYVWFWVGFGLLLAWLLLGYIGPLVLLLFGFDSSPVRAKK